VGRNPISFVSRATARCAATAAAADITGALPASELIGWETGRAAGRG
jgi:hypothetical protein